MIRRQHLNISCSPEVEARIESLMKRSKCDMSEVIRRALAVYDEAIKHQQLGCKVFIRGTDGVDRELILSPEEKT